MRRGTRFTALLLALTLLLSACGEEEALPTATPAPTPTITPVPTPTEAAGTAGFVLPCYSEESFHPLTSDNRANLNVAGLVYEGLFALDAAFTPQGVLCSAQTVSEDGLVWTFTLRPGVTFSDGSPLTPADVVTSLQTAMKETSPYAARLGSVKSVKAGGDADVTVTLSAPNGNLPALLDIPIVRESGDVPLGTGPYVLNREGETLTLQKNAAWWQGKALPTAEVKLHSVKAADTLIYAFDTREISLVAADLTGTNALGFSGSYEVWDYPTSVMLYMGYNARSGACKDAAVRQALSYAFDRSAVAKSLLSGHASAAALPFAPGSALYDAAFAATLDYAPQMAQTQLAAAGQSSLSLTMIVNTDNTYKVAVAEYLAADLGKVGVTVELKKLSWEEYTAALKKGDFDLYLGEVKLTADFDLSPLVRGDGVLNYGGYADAETEALLAAFLAANDTTRAAAASDLSRRLGETAPFTPLCFKNWSVMTHWGRVSGVKATQQNIFYEFSNWAIK